MPIPWVRRILLLLLLSGCTQPRPLALPLASSPGALSERIIAPADPAPELAETVMAAVPRFEAGSPETQIFNLVEAIQYALANNPRLRATQAAILRAEGGMQVAFAPFLPEVNFSYRYVGFTNEVQPTSETLDSVLGFGPGTQFFGDGELRLQWTLWDFGRTASRYGQAVTRREIAELRLERARQTIAYDVSQTYFRVLQARAARLVQQESLRRAEAILQDTKTRREGGVADRDDVLRAEVQLSEVRERLVITSQAELDAVARLNLALGRNVSLPLQVIDWEAQPAFSMTLPDALQVAVEQRREITIARKIVAEQTYGLEAARADFRPRIFVKGLVARIDGIGVETEDVQAAGIHFEQMLYAGQRRLGERTAAQAEVEAATANAQSICDSIALEVNLAYRDIASARQRIELGRISVEQARENLRLVTVKYRNGNATPTDLVDAETALTRSQQRYHTAIFENLASLSRLEYALGVAPGTLLGVPSPCALIQ